MAVGTGCIAHISICAEKLIFKTSL